MKRHIFMTRRATPLPGWRAAFPEAEIRGYPADNEKLVILGGALVWLHIDNRERAPGALVAALLKSIPGCSLVVLSNVPRDEEGLAVLEAGAAGYTSAIAIPDVLRQIETVIDNGGLWVGPDLLRRVLVGLSGHGQNGQGSAHDRLDRLSPREREVALAVAAGATNKEIAQRLDITERTVKAHLSHIFAALKVRDRLQLSILVNGLPPPPTLH